MPPDNYHWELRAHSAGWVSVFGNFEDRENLEALIVWLKTIAPLLPSREKK